jgi:glycosyltransferase involved in cell wall biosynthesis
MNCAVLLNAYKHDDINLFSKAIESVLCQTLEPSELLIVSDGKLTLSQMNLVNKYVSISNFPINLISTPKQLGLWASRNFGINHLTCEFVALMDADDIMHPKKLELQMKYLTNYEVDILGTATIEIDISSDKIVGYRKVLTGHSDIANQLKYKNCINHSTVVLKRKTVLDVGGYLDFYLAEDYELWTRLVASGAKFANLNIGLLGFHVDDNLFSRRGGLKFVFSEFALRRQVIKNLDLNWGFRQIYCLFQRILYRILPTKIRKLAHYKFLSSHKVRFSEKNEMDFLRSLPINFG